MPAGKRKPPAYCLHRPSGRAVVYLARKPLYLGAYGSPESYEAYERALAEWRTQQALPPAPPSDRIAAGADLTINELLLAYFTFAKGYYVHADGRQTAEYANMKYAARPLRQRFGRTRVREFGPRSLKLLQQHLVDAQTLSRQVINHRINRVRSIFRWAVSEELAPAGCYEALRAVAPLKFGRTTAKESPGVKPVPQDYVDAVLPAVAPQVAAMIQLQLLAAMRPQEVVAMRPIDVDRAGDVWIYAPPAHKNRWRGYTREIYLGRKCQAVLAPFLERAADQPCFSPAEAETWRNAQRRRQRRTPMTPSQARRTPKPSPARAKRDRYDRDSYRRAIEYGVAKVNRARREAGEPEIPRWSPAQLRHSRATEVRKTYGVEGAQLMLGHRRADVTQVYAEANRARAFQIARELA